MKDFIDDTKIETMLEKAARPERTRVEEIIAKALELKGLSPEETAVLLQTKDEELIERIWAAAKEIKQANLRQSPGPVRPSLYRQPLLQRLPLLRFPPEQQGDDPGRPDDGPDRQ